MPVARSKPRPRSGLHPADSGRPSKVFISSTFFSVQAVKKHSINLKKNFIKQETEPVSTWSRRTWATASTRLTSFGTICCLCSIDRPWSCAMTWRHELFILFIIHMSDYSPLISTQITLSLWWFIF
jgi:hypothetical protein